MNKSILCTLYLVLCTSLLSSCDEGDIYSKTTQGDTAGLTVHLTARLTGADTWADGYNIVLAGFGADQSDYAVVQKNLPTDIADGEQTELTLTLAEGTSVETVELCVTNQLRERVVTFASVPTSQAVDGQLTLDAGTVDAAMFQAIQTHIFDATCTSCHGASTSAARGLYLTAGQSYAHLVGVESKREPGSMLVQPGNARQSVLYQALTTDLTAAWGQPHFDMLNAEKDASLITLLHDWIQDGAKE